MTSPAPRHPRSSASRRWTAALLVLLACLFAWDLARATIHWIGGSGADTNANSVTVTRPAGVAVGHSLILVVASSNWAYPIATPSGWTRVDQESDFWSSGLVVTVYHRTHAAGDPASVTVPLIWSGRSSAVMLAFDDVDPTSAVAASATAVTASSTSITAPAVTTPAANSMLVGLFAQTNGDTLATAPAGMTKGAEANTAAGPNGTSLMAAYGLQASAGSSGSKTATFSGAARGIGVLLALRPRPVASIGGTVFEDLNYGGGAGRSLAASSGVGRGGATVELYDGSGNFVSSTTTASNGSYSFGGLSAASYFVRVVSGTVLSSRSGATASLLGVLTYLTDASSGAAVGVGHGVGGTNPALADPGSASAGARFNPTNFIFSAGPSGTAHAVAPVTLGASNIGGVDFGFNFDTVVNTNDSGQGSLRQAITNANTLTGDASLAQSGRAAAVEHLVFMIPNGSTGAGGSLALAAGGLRASQNAFVGGIASIAATSALPQIWSSMVIDARTQPGWSGAPIVELNGAGAGAGTHGLTVMGISGQSPGQVNATVAGFVINRFGGNGIHFGWNAGNGIVAGNHIGTNSAASAALANSGAGIYVHGWVAGQTTIGGSTSADRNVISGNGAQGIYAEKNVTVLGNHVGTNAAGNAAVPNVSHGMTVRGGTHVIGGTTAAARNLISGNGGQGVNVETGSTSVLITGNYIGTSVTGNSALGNAGNGVLTTFSNGVTVGGSTPGAGNVISGNGAGGVRLNNTCAGFVVAGNLIGLNAAGTAALPNNGSGVWTWCSGVTVGGATAASRNVISGNMLHGISFGNGGGTARGNWIGLNAAGTAVIANGQDGINAAGSAVILGGASAGMGNNIAGATGSFYAINLANSSGHSVLGNSIGVQGDGVTALAAPGNGVLLSAVNNSTVGGVASGSGNTIRLASAKGIVVTGAASGNAIRGNAIHGSTGLGIDLGNDGVSTNDGAKTSGQPNLRMDQPVITAASLAGTTLTLAGYVGSAAGQSIFASATIDVYLSDGTSSHGSGQAYLGSLSADASGNFSGTIEGVSGITPGSTRITATATDAGNNTSEFGANAAVGLGISGTVFEDRHYGGGAGRSLASALGSAVVSARVELYNASGAFVTSTVTAANGSYGFSGLAAGSYHVRVVSGSVLSTRSGSTSSLLPVLTFRTSGVSGSAVAVTDFVGGTQPGAADAGSGGSGTTLNTTSYVFSAGLTGTAHAVAPVTLGASNITGVDFGFNFTTVVNTNASGQGSLRQVIMNANALGDDSSLAVAGRTAGIEHVVFMIGNGSAAAGLRSSVNLFSAGVATITPGSALPDITAPLVLDARTQPGWTTQPVVALDGTGAGSSTNGLTVSGGGSTVAGLSIQRFGRAGLELASVGGNTVVGNWIGLNSTGSATAGNTDGLNIWNSAGNVIGGSTAAERNLFAGNSNNGLVITGSASANVVRGNWFGLGASGTAQVKNGSLGAYLASTGTVIGGTLPGQGNVFGGSTWHHLYLDAGSSGTVVQGNLLGLDPGGSTTFSVAGHAIHVASSNNTIGGTTSAAANRITAAAGAAVAIIGNGAGNSVLGNSTWGNAGPGIDHGGNGVSANDGLKSAGQPNLLMDSPVFTSARARGTTLAVAGYVGNASGQSLFGGSRVEVFVSDNDATGFGEGRTLLGALTAAADGTFSGTLTLAAALARGSRLTATATDGAGNTSEFGTNFAAVVFDLVVNSLLDQVDSSIGDGSCLTAGGVCTLRAAIAEAVSWGEQATPPTITFNIPGCVAGSCRIQPATALPDVSVSLVIDATTQPGFTSQPIVELNGSVASSVTAGLRLTSGASRVRGLIVNGFGGGGVRLSGSGHVLAGNWIGLNASGTAALANGGGIHAAGSGHTIGGTTIADRNVVSGNTGAGVQISASGVTVNGNWIGLRPDGATAAGNMQQGVLVSGASALISANVISSNGGSGVRLEAGASGAQILGNRIGVAAGDDTARGNGGGGSSGIGIVNAVTDVTIGGTGPGAPNVIAHSGLAGIGMGSPFTMERVRISANSIYANASRGIRLTASDTVPLANNGQLDSGVGNRGMDHAVITAAGLAVDNGSVQLSGYVGSAGGSAVFAGARVEVFRAAVDASGFGEGQVYLGALTVDGNGRFSGTLAITPGSVAIGQSLTATATDGNGNTSEFGPNFVVTSIAAMTPSGFNAFDSGTPLGALTGPLGTRVAGVPTSVDVIALATGGTALHPGFTGTVQLNWVDARNDSGALSGSCRASWVDLGLATGVSFSAQSRRSVTLTPPASATRMMRLRLSATVLGVTVSACSTDAFAVIPALLTLAASDGDGATPGGTRSLNNAAVSGGAVHRAGRPFTVSAQARDALGNLMSAYDGTPALQLTGCVLPAGCTPGTLAATPLAASGGTLTHNGVSYSEVGAISLQWLDTSYADIDSADTPAAARRITSAVGTVGRFVPDALTLGVSSPGTLATGSASCLAAGSGASFFGQGIGWASAPQVTVTARNAAGAVTTHWTGALMKLSAAAATPAMSVGAAGSATLASSFGALALADLGGGSVRLTANSLDRFLLDLPAGTLQASTTATWAWQLAVSDASEAALVGNPTLSASVTQAGVPFDQGAIFHLGRLALWPGHGDARSGVRVGLELQRWSSAGWVTMTEDRGCVTVQPQHLGVESPVGVFDSAGVCVAPLASATTTRGGRAWLPLPATPAGAPGRLTMRLAGAGASGQACSAPGVSQALVPLPMPWLLGGASGLGPAALATWGRPNRDPVLRRETW